MPQGSRAAPLIVAGELQQRPPLPSAGGRDPEGSDRAFRELMDLARSERLTVYDAAYLELALRLGQSLASKHAKLRKAAAALGLAVLGT